MGWRKDLADITTARVQPGLPTVSGVDAMFGCRTSVSRSKLLVIEELSGLPFSPVEYEGEESSKNVFCTGAAPNRQAVPAVDRYLEELGVTRFALLGTRYVYPRTTNHILEAYLIAKGTPKEDIFVSHTPLRPFGVVTDRRRQPDRRAEGPAQPVPRADLATESTRHGARKPWPMRWASATNSPADPAN